MVAIRGSDLGFGDAFEWSKVMSDSTSMLNIETGTANTAKKGTVVPDKNQRYILMARFPA